MNSMILIGLEKMDNRLLKIQSMDLTPLCYANKTFQERNTQYP